MAVTQSRDSGDYKGISNVVQDDSDGYAYFQIGGLRIYIGAGSPDGIITAPKGSIFIRRDSANLYMNTDASTTWSKVSSL